MDLETAQQRRKSTGRNDPCTCGSGKKYKKCHQTEDDQAITAELRRLSEVAAAEAAAKAAAEAEEEKAGGAKNAPNDKASKAAALPKKRARMSAGQTKPRKSKSDKAQSLPRRGAV